MAMKKNLFTKSKIVWSTLFMMMIQLLAIHSETFAQSEEGYSAKNQFYVYWGYNRSAYTQSDLTCVGQGYNFTMNDLQASDNPERFNPKVYFDPKKITIPQFNVRMGYFFNDHWGVSLGYDHMKYVMNNNQRIFLTGHIDEELGAEWSGNYQNDEQLTNNTFIHYENSDGLNYIRAELVRTDRLLALGKNDWFQLESQLGLSTGFILSFNDFNFAGKHDRRTISASGFGLSVHPGIRALFINHIFVQFNMGAGFINQTKVITRPNDRGSFAFQKFGYISSELVFGYRWLFKKRSK
jgi:hypothetical protein